MFKMFWKMRKGVTLIEYALIGSLVAVVAVTALTGLGTAVTGKLDELKTKITNAPASDD